jgi:hypothetical protein
MKWKAPPRRRSAPQCPRWLKPTATKPSKGSIQKRSGARKAPAPSYFSLLQDVVNFLKLDHVEGVSMQKLKRAMEMRYGGRAFDEAECKMLKSAEKRLQNKGHIKKERTTRMKRSPPRPYLITSPNSSASTSSRTTTTVRRSHKTATTLQTLPHRRRLQRHSKPYLTEEDRLG